MLTKFNFEDGEREYKVLKLSKMRIGWYTTRIETLSVWFLRN